MLQKDTFKDSLLGCFEYVPYTALTIVLVINARRRSSNPEEQMDRRMCS